MKTYPTFTLLILILVTACHTPNTTLIYPQKSPMTIIQLSERAHETAETRSVHNVKLKLPYGYIIDNQKNQPYPTYYLFSRDERQILKTTDFDTFLNAVKRLPVGSFIDQIGKCTTPFNSPYGHNIQENLRSFEIQLKLRNLQRVIAQEYHPDHISFCNCTYQTTHILENAID